MADKVKYYAKRMADYVRMSIESGEIKRNSPIGIAYRDFMIEWNLTQQKDSPDKDIRGFAEPERCEHGVLVDKQCLYCNG